jgi:hypothetical protein
VAVRWHRSAGAAWSRSRRASGPAPGRSGRLCTGRMLVGADHGGIDHLQLLLGHTAVGQGRQDRLKDAQVTPAREAAPDRVPLPVPLRDRSPARPFACPPQDAVQVAPGLPARPAALRHQQWSDQFPLHVRQITSRHIILPPQQRRENQPPALRCPSSTRPSVSECRPAVLLTAGVPDYRPAPSSPKSTDSAMAL